MSFGSSSVMGLSKFEKFFYSLFGGSFCFSTSGLERVDG